MWNLNPAEFVENLLFDDSQIAQLEKVTKKQSVSTIWWEKPKGRLSASNYGDICEKCKYIS